MVGVEPFSKFNERCKVYMLTCRLHLSVLPYNDLNVGFILICSSEVKVMKRRLLSGWIHFPVFPEELHMQTRSKWKVAQ